jgi:hypothetical protein
LNRFLVKNTPQFPFIKGEIKRFLLFNKRGLKDFHPLFKGGKGISDFGGDGGNIKQSGVI